jgi:hypothetical protein
MESAICRQNYWPFLAQFPLSLLEVFRVVVGAGLRNVLSSRLSHTELRSLLRESQSLLSLSADTTTASSQGTQQN